MMKKILLLLLLLASWQVQAQTTIPKKLQEFEQEIAEKKVDEIKILKNYLDLISLYSPIDIQKTYRYFHEGIAYTHGREDLIDWESACWRRMSEVYADLGKIDSSYYCIHQAIELLEGTTFNYDQCTNYQVLGIAYTRGNEHEKALEAYLKVLEFNEKDKSQKIEAQENIQNNLGLEASTYSLIAMIYKELLNYDKAIEYLLRAKKIMDENPTKRSAFVLFQIEMLGELAELYMATQQQEQALPLFNRCYELAAEREFFPEMVSGLCRLSSFYYTERKDFKQALAFAKEALPIAEKTERPYLIGSVERNLMRAYFGLKEYQSARHYAERALSRTEEDALSDLQDIYGSSIMIYAFLGNAEQSEAYLEKYNEITAKISDKNMHNALQEMEVKYDVQQKELEITQQKAEIDRQRSRQYMYLGGLVVAGVLVASLIYIVTLRTRRARLLAEMNATKDKFFSIISHDLKNPAIAQRDAIQTLFENVGLWDNQALKNYYQSMLRSADNQVDLLYNLLNWAQVQTGRMPYTPALFDLAACLRTDLALLQNLADRKGIDLQVHFPEKAFVTGDSDMVATVVRNLATNAIKFTGSGGKVTLDITDQTVSVSDTGMGMTDEERLTLFTIDRQQTHTGTAGEQSSGLGLIVCRELLQKHGTTLQVESQKGVGSRFWFTLTP